MTNHYQGPSLAHSPDAQKIVRARLQTEVRSLARQLHAEAITTWAGDDDTPYPEFADSLSDAAGQFQVLINGLGAWAAVDPLIWSSRSLSRRTGWRPSFILDDLEFGED